MTDIFVSYSRDDQEIIVPIASAISAQGWSVFWDRNIRTSESFMQVLEEKLKEAKCVIVFWSLHSVVSRFVIDEVSRAVDRGIPLFPILIGPVRKDIPLGFGIYQMLDLINWNGDLSAPGFKQLIKDMEGIIESRRAVVTIAKPATGELVTIEHLALIHSSWRVPLRDKEFSGRRMYQIHLIVYGHNSALDRIDHVNYRLDPAYPNPFQTKVEREKNFELKELANGYSVIWADIIIKGQVEQVNLSRFINLTETGPRLDTEFIKGNLQIR